MFKLRDISIRNKLILMQVFTSVLVLSIFFTAFVFADIRNYKQRKLDSIISLAQVISANNISTLQFQDDDAARSILYELHNVSPEIIQAGIVDKNGKIFATYSKNGIDSFNIPETLSGRRFLYTTRQLFVSNDIVNEKELLGKVYLAVDLQELAQLKQAKFAIGTVLVLVALGFSFLIAIMIQTYVSKRLLNLVGKMKIVSETGNYNATIVEDGKDEISILIKVYNNLLRQVKENQDRKDEFIGIASHELKTPLTSIKGYLELLKSMEDRQPHQQCVQKAMDNVVKLERLIKDLLDVSKIQSGHLELDKKEFPMGQLLQETVASMQIVSHSHEIVLEDKLQSRMITADPQRIEQVLLNLISNAIKYSPGEKKVIVSSQSENGNLVIKVRDFGVGIPEEEQSNIFERFYRAKDMPIHISGFGLGLYICRSIIDRHSGRLWMKAEEKGSSFYFSLPLKSKTPSNSSEQ